MSRVLTLTERPVIRGAQHCPSCGLPPERTDSRATSIGTAGATFLCAQSHLWSVSWVVAG